MSRYSFHFNAIYAALFSLLILLFVVMAHALIGLNFEGSHWFFEILNQHKLVYASDEWRWTDTLWQLPAYFSMKWLPWISFSGNLYILSYSYTLFPLLGILFCYLLVRKEKNVFLYMSFPLLSLATAVATSLSFVVGIANGTVTFFWPLLFILIFKSLDNLKYFLTSALLLFLLSFNYDAALVVMPLLVFAILHKSNFKPQKYERILIGLIVTSFVFQIYRLVERYYIFPGSMTTYWVSLLEQIFSTYIYRFQLAILTVFFIGLQLFDKLKKPVFLWIGIFICASIGLFWYYRVTEIFLFEARENRSASIITAWGIAAGLLYFKKFLDTAGNENVRRYIICCTSICIMMSLVFNFYNLKRWNNYRSTMLSVLEGEKGCIFVDQKRNLKSVAFVSLLLQKTNSPQAIILTSDRACTGEYTDPCEQYVKQEYPVFNCRYLHLTAYNMDLSQTKVQTKKKEAPSLRIF